MVLGRVLMLSNFAKPFIIERDISRHGVWAVLMQNNKSIAYFSQAIKTKDVGLSTYEKQMLALIFTMECWRLYLLGQTFVVWTDHKSLKFLWDQCMTNPSNNVGSTNW